MKRPKPHQSKPQIAGRPLGNTGFSIDADQVRLDAYRLLTIFLAEERFASLRTGDSDSAPDILYNEFARLEIERLLINIAILVRMTDDASREGRTLDQASNPVVRKLTRSKGDADVDLLLRDACNKIIHANAVIFRKTSGEFSWTDKLEPLIELKGKLNSNECLAVVDVHAFCEAVVGTPEVG